MENLIQQSLYFVCLQRKKTTVRLKTGSKGSGGKRKLQLLERGDVLRAAPTGGEAMRELLLEDGKQFTATEGRQRTQMKSAVFSVAGHEASPTSLGRVRSLTGFKHIKQV